MTIWQGELLKDVLRAQARLVIAADPDGLLTDEKAQQEIRERGFEMITYGDPVAFRHEYESGYRSQWDSGRDVDKRVLLRVATRDLNVLPYDLLEAGTKATLTVSGVFPNLSYPILEIIPVEHLDKLCQAYQDARPARMGDSDTCDFILLHVFKLATEAINEPEQLLNCLLRIHFDKHGLPQVLGERLISLLEGKPAFKKWPVRTLVGNREVFFQFLQERWPIFLNRIGGSDPLIHEKDHGFPLRVEGPQDIPLEHKDVHIFLDDLFMEGLIHPVPHESARRILKIYKWAKAGIVTGEETENAERLEAFLESMKASIPGAESRYHEWLDFAGKWARLSELRYSVPKLEGSKLEQQVNGYRQAVDTAFHTWLVERYAGLYNLPSDPPVMQHHIARSLAKACLEQGARVALVVMDGMSFDQWLTIKQTLLHETPSYRFDENAVFAWAPTITSVCRQSIFAGKIPANFASSIMTTEKEATLWTQFWEQQGLGTDSCCYLKGLGDAANLNAADEQASSPKTRALGLVVDKVDKIMHGAELGSAGMQSQVMQWAKEGYLGKLLAVLRTNNYQIYLTSDHGNVETNGCGRPKEGAIADMPGQRVRVYPDSGLRAGVADGFPGSIQWPAIGLPDGFFPLIAAERTAFIPQGHRSVSHGGVCIEEIIVPFVKVHWSKQ